MRARRMSKAKLPFRRDDKNADDPAAMNDEAIAAATKNMKKYEPMKPRASGKSKSEKPATEMDKPVKYEPFQKATVIKDLNDMPEVAAHAALAEDTGNKRKKRSGALKVQGSSKRAKKVKEGGGGGGGESSDDDDDDEDD